LTIIAFALGLTVLLVGGFFYLNRPQVVTITASIPESFPPAGFSHAVLEQLLEQYVDDQGNVDYDRWHRNRSDRESLEQYLAAVSKFSPQAAAERFAKRSDELAYWLYAYNAYVIRSVLEHWPLESVTDVRAPIEAVKGLGFFYRQRFVFGGEVLSLYAVEHEKILATFRDPRIHFVLNCASESCPVLRPELPVGDELEQLLVSATIDFVNDPRNVHVNHEKQQIILSTIFKWYRNDFLNDLRRRGRPVERGVVDYIAETATAELRADIEAAAGYELVFEDYDWAINSQHN
jgi:hypothetical protein